MRRRTGQRPLGEDCVAKAVLSMSDHHPRMRARPLPTAIVLDSIFSAQGGVRRGG
jgi:hypothetical protein